MTIVRQLAHALHSEHTKLNWKFDDGMMMGMPRVFCIVYSAAYCAAIRGVRQGGRRMDLAPEAHGPLDDQHLDLSLCLT